MLEFGFYNLLSADDTLLVVKGSSLREFLIKTELGATIVIRIIERLSFKVSIAKMEAIVFAWEVPRVGVSRKLLFWSDLS